MATTVIEIEHVSKRYMLGRVGSTSLREDLERWWARTRRPSIQKGGIGPKKDMWALRDVNLHVEQGDIVGIIGRNGAGKSTLLRILSRITAPTAGVVKVRGRISSLLEVGTGFHPELSGRENIYLNGAILGLRTHEISQRFDEIAAFADVEAFLDTPVKHYSSGMYVRLAFAVAAHLEPEILVVDEVLAVGDASFQRKCLGKMDDVARSGTTVLFVSHNNAAIENLCTRAVLLDRGAVISDTTPAEAIARYTQLLGAGGTRLANRTDRFGSGLVRVTKIEFQNRYGHSLQTACSGQELLIRLHFETAAGARVNRVKVGLMVKTQMDTPVFFQHNEMAGKDFGYLPSAGIFTLRLPRLPLPASVFRLRYTVMGDDGYMDGLDNAAELTVIEGDFFGTGEVCPISHGVCLVDGTWSLDSLQNDSDIFKPHARDLA